MFSPCVGCDQVHRGQDCVRVNVYVFMLPQFKLAVTLAGGYDCGCMCVTGQGINLRAPFSSFCRRRMHCLFIQRGAYLYGTEKEHARSIQAEEK